MAIRDLDWESQDPPGPATESSEERGFERDTDDDALGESEELTDPDDADEGDLADEGFGKRG